MKIKQTIRNLTLGALFVFGLTFFLLPATTFAECRPDAPNCCGGVETSVIGCSETGEGGDATNTGLWAILLMAINILTAGVGVVALAGIVYGSILYTSSGGNQEQVKKAIGVFTNVVIGIIAFAGMWALLNFLVPGGVFSSGQSQNTTQPVNGGGSDGSGGAGEGGGGSGGGV